MKYKEYLGKYVGQKAHFDFDQVGYYLLDFTGKSYANVDVLEVHTDCRILFDEVEKTNMIVPYERLLIRYLDEDVDMDSEV